MGAGCEVYLKGHLYKKARIVAVKTLKLAQVNTFIAKVDTGYDVEQFDKMVRQMYKNKVLDIDKALWDLVLLETINAG